MRVLLAVLGLLALSACLTAPPTAPVPVSCVAKGFPPAPSYSDTRQALKDAPNPATRYQLMGGNWFPRDARLTVLEKQVDACR